MLSVENVHHMVMSALYQGSGVLRLRWRWRAAARLLACLLIFPTSLISSAQTSSVQTSAKTPADHYYDPLPQETGTAGLQLMLRRLHTTGRLMQVESLGS